MTLGLGVALLVGGCTVAASPAPSSAPLRVAATTTVFADFVKQVGGTRVAVTSIIPPGTDAHDFEPTPGDSRTVADAQLVVSNGVGFDDFLDKLITTTATKAALLVLGDGVPTIEMEGEPNPHFWLDPSIVVQHYVPAIRDKLSQVDPAGAANYAQNATAYLSQLESLDAELKTQLAQIPASNRKLVTFHDAFPYFARHYGFELIGVIMEHEGQDPSAGELAELVDKVKAAGVKAVFSEAQFSPKLTQTLADEAGITKVVATLYNDALGDPPADTYLGMMRWNASQVVEALR
jgi:ABC-type Zn uptake system ZnuABC Zn-binding protein ZnuA